MEIRRTQIEMDNAIEGKVFIKVGVGFRNLSFQ